MSASDWKWFGSPAHFICAEWCRFHMATLVGNYVVSTVGEYIPDESVRELLAESRGLKLEGRGEARRADWLKKNGFEELGYQRTYETMVFKWTGDVCDTAECGCGLPSIDPSEEFECRGYNNAGDATRGHHELCQEYDGRKES